MIFLLLFLNIAFAAPTQLTPPLAPERPYEHKLHGDVRPDPYFWLRDRKDPDTIPYLRAENAYADNIMKPYKSLQATIHQELKSYIKQTDMSYPVKDGRYLYYYKMKKGADYPVHYRRLVDKPQSEAVLLDENLLAKGKDYMRVGAFEVSDDGTKLAYTVDTKGDRLHTVYFKDLKTGRLLKETITNAGSELAWSADGKSIFYVRPEDVTLRARWVYRHMLGDKKDEIIFEEKDPQFDVEIENSLTKKFIFIISRSKNTNETWFLEAAKALEKPKVFQPRAEDIQYSVEDGGDRFYIRTNLNAENFRLMESPLDKTANTDWKEVVAHNPDVFIERVLVQREQLVLQQRRKGIPELEVRSRLDNSAKIVEQKEKDPYVYIGDNREYDASDFRFRYESMTTPPSTIDYEYKSGKKTVRHVEEVLGGFKSENYVSDRIDAEGHDGVKIPISVVHKKGLKAGEKTPLLLYAYGSYGLASDSEFERAVLPLLDRGFVYAVAHVRGGTDLGRAWYLNGKMMKKKNTFLDFISAAEHLVKSKWTSSKHLYIKGVSAGGLLMGAVINMRPDLFNGVIANVPFVDVMTTMLDATLPLTTGEYVEWGNPNEKAAYDYMRSYSPYDNITKQTYPNLLVRAGLNDTQVGYWEPAKWVARLRRMKTGNNLILFKTELESGHSGKNGRFSGLEALALEDAFLLMLEQGSQGKVRKR